MKKIMFNDQCGLTQAVLEGRKTMTRRTIDVNPEFQLVAVSFDKQGRLCVTFDSEDGNVGDLMFRSMYRIGEVEVVAVAQSYNDIYEELKRTHGSSSSVTRNFFHKYIQGGRMPVSNKMFVKSEAMLHQIKITDIKVERLQDISDEDCIKEGIIIDTDRGVLDDNIYMFEVEGKHYCQWHLPNPREAFAALIYKVSGKGTWERNPWVFAYTFELVK